MPTELDRQIHLVPACQTVPELVNMTLPELDNMTLPGPVSQILLELDLQTRLLSLAPGSMMQKTTPAIPATQWAKNNLQLVTCQGNQEDTLQVKIGGLTESLTWRMTVHIRRLTWIRAWIPMLNHLLWEPWVLHRPHNNSNSRPWLALLPSQEVTHKDLPISTRATQVNMRLWVGLPLPVLAPLVPMVTPSTLKTTTGRTVWGIPKILAGRLHRLVPLNLHT
jgi:hypothetical protein